MLEKILVPDVGEADDVEVVELLVAVGDMISVDDSLVVLESDKASMEIPSPFEGKVTSIAVAEGDKVEEGTLLFEVETEAGSAAEEKPAADDDGEEQADEAGDDEAAAEDHDSAAVVETSEAPVVEETAEETAKASSPPPSPAPEPTERTQSANVHAGPAVRKQARELGVTLAEVKGTGQKGRILKEDVEAYVKERLAGGAGKAEGTGIPPVPEVDFAKFGEIEYVPLSRIRKARRRSERNVADMVGKSSCGIPHRPPERSSTVRDVDFRGW